MSLSLRMLAGVRLTLLVGLLLMLGSTRVSAASAFTTYPTTMSVLSMASGSDGNLWCTGQVIGRVTTTGVETDFPISGRTFGNGICLGPDGNVWALAHAQPYIERIATDGTYQEFTLAAGWGFQVVSGPDGALWVTTNGDTIERITTSGSTKDFPLEYGPPWGICAGPDGALWFTIPGVDQVGRITTTGVITLFQFAVGADPMGICTGSDQALWIACSGGLARLTTDGHLSTYATGAANSELLDVVAGPDQALWSVDASQQLLYRYTTAGQLSVYTVQNLFVPPVVGPDQRLWFPALNSSAPALIALDLSLLGPPTTSASIAGTTTGGLVGSTAGVLGSGAGTPTPASAGGGSGRGCGLSGGGAALLVALLGLRYARRPATGR